MTIRDHGCRANDLVRIERTFGGVGWVRELLDGHPLVTADRDEALQLELAAARLALRRLARAPVGWHLERVPAGTPEPIRWGHPTA